MDCILEESSLLCLYLKRNVGSLLLYAQYFFSICLLGLVFHLGYCLPANFHSIIISLDPSLLKAVLVEHHPLDIGITCLLKIESVHIESITKFYLVGNYIFYTFLGGNRKNKSTLFNILMLGKI